MKRTFGLVAALILALNFWGCSSSGPQADGVGIEDQTPVVGQRVLLQVMAETDNPPMRYVWNCPNGRLEGLVSSIQAGAETDQYFAYWVPPAVGQYTVTCTVIDADNNEETIDFPITVTPRGTYRLASQGVRHIAKDYSAKSGGIWAAIFDSNLSYYSSKGTTDAGWGKDVFTWTDPDPISALAVSTYASTYYAWNNLWAVRQRASAWELVSHSVNGDAIYACSSGTCTGINEIRAVRISNGTVWIGTDAGLFSFGTVGLAWSGPVVNKSVTDIYAVNDLVYVATTAGIYYSADKGLTWPQFAPPRWTRAITGYKDPTSGELTLYALTDPGSGYTVKRFNSDGTEPATYKDLGLPAPADFVDSLDSDLLGNIWMGKHVWDARLHAWDGASEMKIIGLDDSSDPVERSLVSPEGLVYLKGAHTLWVWGKK